MDRPGSTQDEYHPYKKEKNRVTLHGVLVGKEESVACGAPNIVLSFNVENTFGIYVPRGNTMTIATAASSAACGVDYPLGTEVLVFADNYFSCNQPSDLIWTYLMSNNISMPTRSQLDSLNGLPSVGLNR